MNSITQPLINNTTNTPIPMNQMNHPQMQHGFQPTIVPTYTNCYQNTLSLSQPNTNYSYSPYLQSDQLSCQLNVNYFNNYNAQQYPNEQLSNNQYFNDESNYENLPVPKFPNKYKYFDWS